MSWRDQLLPASFRGVAFYVESSEVAGGRRVVDHEIPFSAAAPFSEDLGRKGRGFALECYVLGAEYMSARNSLLSALEVEGPGELVHPYHGTQRVVSASFRVRESSREGGFAAFTIEFRETSAEPTQPATVFDGPALVTSSASALNVSAGDEFLAKFDELAAFRDSITGALSAATDAVSLVVSKAAMPGQVVASITAQVDELTATASTLLSAPAELVDTLGSLVSSLGEGLLLVEGALDPLAALLTLFSFDPGLRPTDTTPSRLAEQANFDALQNLIKRQVLAQASLVAIEQTFITYDDAVRARLSITDLIDQHCDETADDVYPALQNIRRDLVNAVPGVDADLPRIVRHTPRVTLPSLVLAHTLYGNLDLEEDLVRRNRVSHPGFVTGGVELEVLSE